MAEAEDSNPAARLISLDTDEPSSRPAPRLRKPFQKDDYWIVYFAEYFLGYTANVLLIVNGIVFYATSKTITHRDPKHQAGHRFLDGLGFYIVVMAW